MPQLFKSVYYPNRLGDSRGGRNLAIAFGKRDQGMFEMAKSLSSCELRQMMGFPTWSALHQAADAARLTVNRFCMRQLRRSLLADADANDRSYLPGLNPRLSVAIDPIQSTYRGGTTEPLHQWYPYLEAYSPLFVQRVIEEFAPDARSVLDPFAGLGTTPIAAAGMGRKAFYCELNPVLQRITEVKLMALASTDKARWKLSSELLELAGTLETSIAAQSPDDALGLTYHECFGNSEFFGADVYDTVRRARTLIDNIACTSRDRAELLLVAVLASLIPASKLIRRGDVRFKTPNESRRLQTSFVSAVADRLQLMAKDLVRLPLMGTRPELLSGDARQLGIFQPLEIDALLTSPPYLNGTNYFRNTKIELWFLRCLLGRDDLARFRRQAVTAGINDVTVGKASVLPLPMRIEETVRRVEKSAYDSRIPLMVRSYFTDMRQVIRAAQPHLSPSAPILIDIGDSAYAGVHVPTHRLLADLLAEDGYRAVREICLRKRMSRSGLALTQMLMVFRPTTSKLRGKIPAIPQESLRRGLLWRSFKDRLPHRIGDYAKRNWGHSLHSLCSYQGKMKPSIASHLVKAFVPVGGRMLDPFAGVGTIPFEAALNGVKAFAFDISPAALHISAAKLGQNDKAECHRIIAELERRIRLATGTEVESAEANNIRFNGALRDYFHPGTFAEILTARNYFRDRPPHTPSESLVLASLLHILHGNRPYALSRRSHPITPFSPTGPIEYRALIPRLREKVQRSLDADLPPSFLPGEVLRQDATESWAPGICELDAIITSPPFYDSTRFYLANWMRLWFCGWNAQDFRTKPLMFIDERQKKDFGVYRPLFRQARERLKKGGVLVLHLGKSRKCDMAKELSILATPWFRVADVFSESVQHCESHGIRDKGAVSEHTYLVLD